MLIDFTETKAKIYYIELKRNKNYNKLMLKKTSKNIFKP